MSARRVSEEAFDSKEVKSMNPKILLSVVCATLIAHGATAGAFVGDAKPSDDDPCSVTLLVQGMMKSRSGAT